MTNHFKKKFFLFLQLKYKNKRKSVKINTEHLLIGPISMKMIDRIHGSMLCQKEGEQNGNSNELLRFLNLVESIDSSDTR